MADRIAVLNDGRLQQVGEPQAVYARPANLFVARFIGSPPMNTIEGVLRADGTDVVVELDGGHLAVDIEDPVVDGQSVVAGIRPEHLVIGPGPLHATVRAIEWLGHERHVYCDIGETSAIVRDTEDGGDGSRPGDEITLSAKPDTVHLFDAATTDRMN